MADPYATPDPYTLARAASSTERAAEIMRRYVNTPESREFHEAVETVMLEKRLSIWSEFGGGVEGHAAAGASLHSNPQASPANRYGIKIRGRIPGPRGESKDNDSRYQARPANLISEGRT